MRPSLHIAAKLDQPHLLESLVEKLAGRRYDIGFSHAEMPKNLEALETSSTQTFISGTLAIADKSGDINMPFITQFCFTCTKGKNDAYKLAWSCSMS